MAAPAAQASVPCLYSVYVNYSYDYARITDTSGGCSAVAVNHKYNPVWSSNDYWTGWFSGGDVAQTPRMAELYQESHYGY